MYAATLSLARLARCLSLVQIDFGRGPPSQTYSVAVRCTMERPDTHPTFVDGKPRVASQLTNEFYFVFYCKDVTRTPLVFPRTCKCTMILADEAARADVFVFCHIIMQMRMLSGIFVLTAA